MTTEEKMTSNENGEAVPVGNTDSDHPIGPDVDGHDQQEHADKKTRNVAISGELKITASRTADGKEELSDFMCRRRCISILDELKKIKELGYDKIVGIFEIEDENRSDPLGDGDTPYVNNILGNEGIGIDEVMKIVYSHFEMPKDVISDLQRFIETASIWSMLDTAIVTLTFHGGAPASFAFISPESGDLEIRVVGDTNEMQVDKYKDAMRRSRHIVFATDKVIL